jgi:hypothetical protein
LSAAGGQETDFFFFWGLFSLCKSGFYWIFRCLHPRLCGFGCRFCLFPPLAEKCAYKERLRRDLLIASQRMLLLAACGKQNRRKSGAFFVL